MNYPNVRPKHLDVGLSVKRGKVKTLETFVKVGDTWYSLKTSKKERKVKK